MERTASCPPSCLPQLSLHRGLFGGRKLTLKAGLLKTCMEEGIIYFHEGSQPNWCQIKRLFLPPNRNAETTHFLRPPACAPCMFWAKVGGISATLWLVSFGDPKALFFSVADRDTQGKGLVSRIQKELLQTQQSKDKSLSLKTR